MSGELTTAIRGYRSHMTSRSTELGRRSTLDEFVRGMLRRRTDQLISNEAGVRLGADPEAVHQARVATRRLRSDLKSLRPVLEPDETQRIRLELQWLAGLLGDVRDSQVLRSKLSIGVDRLEHVDEEARVELDRVIVEQCEARRAPLLSAMSGDRYRLLLDDLSALSEHPPFRDDAPVGDHALPVVRRGALRSWKQVRRAVDQLDDRPTDVELHELRKKVKHARYDAQSALSIGAASKEAARSLGTLQDQLGELQDAVVAMAWLSTAVGRLSPRAAFLAGRLHEAASRRHDELETTWRETWVRLDRPRHRRWMG